MICPTCGGTKVDPGGLGLCRSCKGTEPLRTGEYVLATKFLDGNPGDPWAVGYYVGTNRATGRVIVHDAEGRNIRPGGFRVAARIRQDVGAWLLSVGPFLEKSPPGTVNLWTMLTVHAYTMEDL